MLALRSIAVALVALVLLAGCGDEPDGFPSDQDRYAAADVTFARDMVAHHTQALEMVDLTDGRDLDATFAALVREIRETQAPEIASMNRWLELWSGSVPSTASSPEMDDMEGMHHMDGMLSDDQLEQLATASDDDFEQLWLQLMIEHHQGALEMAQTELDEGTNALARELAQDVIDTQQSEIETMQDLLAD
ncbi:MAG: DUF305 domain-containing protein [Actinobacteria bacterium]|uniref:Unannotated protein n=1 Tax=freshwater metagenome TaxID=449393 RepID=A0A6J6Q7U8_9ZZZZ|nr:DUF305 domain-containing protein [Actinomycetota bacterium]